MGTRTRCTTAVSCLFVPVALLHGRSSRSLLCASTDYEPSFQGCGCVKPQYVSRWWRAWASTHVHRSSPRGVPNFPRERASEVVAR